MAQPSHVESQYGYVKAKQAKRIASPYQQANAQKFISQLGNHAMNESSND
jgi:hypothetical protein